MSPAEVKSRALYTKNLFKIIFLCFMKTGHFWPLEATKCKKPYSGKPKIIFFSFSGLQRPKMTFSHKIQKKILFKIRFFCVLWRGVIFGLRRPQNAKNLILGTQKSFLFPFSGLQRPKMTFWHKIQRNSFQNRVFCVFWWGVIFGPGG